jgi:hypothetical protein
MTLFVSGGREDIAFDEKRQPGISTFSSLAASAFFGLGPWR